MIAKSPSWLGHPVPALLLFFLLLVPSLHAQEPADPTVELKKQLRAVMLQLRTAQTDTANAQAATAAAEVKNKDLTSKIEDLEKTSAALAKRTNTEKATAEETIDRLHKTLADRENRIGQFQKSLDEWKAGYQRAAAVANAKEDQRATLAAEAIVLKRTIADRERKNISLFNTANEILDRYRDYSLGKAITAREPFIGTTRVKIENQVQGYQDQILDQRIEATAGKR